MRRTLSALLLALGLCKVAAAATFDASDAVPMRFSRFWSCTESRPSCSPRILARGHIEADSGKKLRDFLAHERSLDPLGMSLPWICFNSPGGDLGGALTMGSFIRQEGLDTCVDSIGVPVGDNSQVAVENPICASSCVYALAGGVNRRIAHGAIVGVHQFFGASKDIGQSNTQQVMSELARYLDSMGVRRELLDAASAPGPSQVQVLSETDLVHYRLKTSEIDATKVWSSRRHRWSSDHQLEAWSYRPSVGAEATVFVSVRRSIPGAVYLEVDVDVGTEALDGWLNVMNRLPVSLTVDGNVIHRDQNDWLSQDYFPVWHSHMFVKGVAVAGYIIHQGKGLEALASGSRLALRIEGKIPAAVQDVTFSNPSFDLPLAGLPQLLLRIMGPTTSTLP